MHDIIYARHLCLHICYLDIQVSNKKMGHLLDRQFNEVHKIIKGCSGDVFIDRKMENYRSLTQTL